MGGASFGSKTPFEIIGIASHVRVESTETPDGDELFLAYNRITPDYSPLAFVVRLEHERQLPALASLVRSLAPGAIVRTDLVDNRFNRLYGDVLWRPPSPAASACSRSSLRCRACTD